MLYWLCHVGYADDLTLFASSLCELQRMIDICVDEAANLCMQFDSKKCCYSFWAQIPFPVR